MATIALKRHRSLNPIPPLLSAARAIWSRRKRTKPDVCGMVYYDTRTGFFFFTHRVDEGEYRIVLCYESGRAIHPAVDKEFPSRQEAEDCLGRLAVKENLLRQPGLAGRWS